MNNQLRKYMSTLKEINPNYISGLTQSDGSFFCAIKKNSNSRFGFKFVPTFSITVDLDSILVLEKIKEYFNCGIITINNSKHSVEYRVQSIKKLQNIIIPHFSLYPVYLAKYHALKSLSLIVNLLENKTHFTIEGTIKIVNYAYLMNQVTNRT
jgi:LAGLIDADG endonuclease